MKHADPLDTYFRAARHGAERPLDPAEREALWRGVTLRRARAVRQRALAVGLVAAAAVLCLVALGRRPPAPSPRRAPEVALPVAPALPPPDAHAPPAEDATVVALDATARFSLARDPAADAMTVTLTAGGVRCTVAHREGRRFTVLADDVRVDDRGTRFDVALSDAWVRVTVYEGRVDVTSAGRVRALAAGEEARFPRRAPTAAPRVEAREDVNALLAEADRAMARNDTARAAGLLGRVVSQHRAHPRAQAAALRLGRLLRDDGRHDEAARAFADARALPGAMAEIAWRQEITALVAAGRREAARARAAEYAARHPRGLHLDALRSEGLLP